MAPAVEPAAEIEVAAADLGSSAASPPDVATAKPNIPPRPTPRKPEIKIKFGAETGRLVSQETYQNEHHAIVRAVHGASRSVYLGHGSPGGYVLRVLDEKGEIRELARWPRGSLYDVKLEPSGDVTALVGMVDEQIVLERFDSAGNSLSKQTMAGSYKEPAIAIGAGDTVLLWANGLGRVRTGESGIVAVPLKFTPKGGAFDSQGALLVAGRAGRGGAPIAKYTQDLRPVWERRFDRPGCAGSR